MKQSRILVSGPQNIGKSTVCLKLADLLKAAGFSCGGIICPKQIVGKKYVGYSFLDVATGERQKFLSLGSLDGPYDERLGGFSASEDALDAAKYSLRKGLKADVVFADELGPAEILYGRGLQAEVDLAHQAKSTLVLGVQDRLVAALCEKYARFEFNVFEINKKNRDSMPEKIVRSLLD